MFAMIRRNYMIAQRQNAHQDTEPSNLNPMKALLSTVALTFALSGILQAATPPVNEVCPVCGKNARLIFRSTAPSGDRVIFATAECKDKFEKSPGSYQIKKKAN